MDKQRWKTIGSIVDEALNLPQKEWRTFIGRECGSDHKLRKEVEKLLRSIEASEGLWDQLLHSHKAIAEDYSRTLSHLNSDSYISQAPFQIGPYQLKKCIGKGGMGDVYRAERMDGQYHQTVAVKLMSTSIGLEDSYHRFRQERQILATLNHPNIAGLLDGGITDDGRPYLVMEYVDGVPITKFCKENNCSLDRRLELFGQVCRAVQYAHRNLVVHRDLKPENILVTKEGVLKVLDFGIAKLIDTELTEQTIIETRAGQRMMSLCYAAPEQVNMEQITTATDVYALGLLLYELLTGTRPFALNGKSLAEAEQIIRRRDPARPSQHSADWQKYLKGDLDAITLKALRKEPEQRYESAGQLLEDISRYNENMPVIARSDTLRYRTLKFLKRHRAGLTVTSTILIMTVGFGLYHTRQVTQERNMARLEAEKARQITNFLIDVFEYSNPTTKSPDEITAREILDEGADYIRSSMADQPEIQATLLNTMGRIYNNLGLYAQAKPMLANAMDIYRTYSPQSNLGLTLHNLGDLYTNVGQYDSAAYYLQEAIDHYRTMGNDAFFAGSMESLGWVHYTLGNYKDADSLFLKALPIQKKIYGAESPEVAHNIQLRAWVQHDLGQYDAADSLFRQVLSLRRFLLGNEHKDVATTLHSLGWILYQKGAYVQADSVMQEALTLRKRLYPEGHMDLAWSLNNMGLVQQALGRFEEAENLFKGSLEMRKTILGEEHPHVAQSLGNLAGLFYRQQEYAEAALMFEEVIFIDQKRLGENNLQVGIDYNNLAAVLNKSGKKRQALEYYGKALHIIKQSLPASHPNVVRISDNMADVHLDLEEYEKAEQLYLTCFYALKENEGVEHHFTQVMSKRLAGLYEKIKQPEKASYYRSLLVEGE